MTLTAMFPMRSMAAENAGIVFDDDTPQAESEETESLEVPDEEPKEEELSSEDIESPEEELPVDDSQIPKEEMAAHPIKFETLIFGDMLTHICT